MTVKPVTVRESERVDVRSTSSGRGYRLMIATPSSAPPEDGYPLLLVLDGDAYFGFMTDVTRNRGVIGNEIAAPVVVGIAYADEDPDAWLTRRSLEFTPTDPPEEQRTAQTDALEYGGAGAFLDAIEHDILPAISDLVAIDASRMAIFGHSLGGLAVLQTLFTKSCLFQSYIAVSPAIWWAPDLLATQEAAFVERVREKELAPRVLIAVGALEETPPERVPAWSDMSLEQVAEHVRSAAMVSNARDLASRLAAGFQGIAAKVRFAEPVDETHISVPYAVIREALDLAFPPDGDNDV